MIDYLLHYISSIENVRLRADVIRKNLIFKYPNWNIQKDSRIIIFEQIISLILSYNLSLTYVVIHYQKPETLIKLVGLESHDDCQTVCIRLLTFYKNSLVYNLSAIVEAFNRNIYKCIISEKQIYYYQLIKKLIHYFDEDNQELGKALIILLNIRNCIHNNGIYVSDSKDRNKLLFIYHGYSLEFEHDMPQKNASNEILNLIINDTISFFEKVVENTEVKNIPLIKDIIIPENFH